MRENGHGEFRLKYPMKKENGDYDYSQLIFDHPVLSDCRRFQPSDILLGTIWDILRNKACLDPLILRKLKPDALGSTISSGL